MSKWKARLCTALLVIVLTIALTASFFVKSYYGFSLYQLILGAIGYLWIGERIEKFYKWLLKE
jgi:hypothetical protein